MLLAMGRPGCCTARACAAVSRRWPDAGLLYTLGRATAYVFLGTLAGALGEAVVRAAPLGAGARVLAVAGGLLLLAAGLESLGLVRIPGLVAPERFAAAIAGLARGGPAGSLLFGFLNGLLPCPMVYGFLGMAAATGSVAGGAATMLTLAATSTVPLLACGWFVPAASAARGRWPAGS